jgi:hypothetical protein
MATPTSTTAAPRWWPRSPLLDEMPLIVVRDLRALIDGDHTAALDRIRADERERADAFRDALDRMVRDMTRGQSVYVIKEMRALIDADNDRIARNGGTKHA